MANGDYGYFGKGSTGYAHEVCGGGVSKRPAAEGVRKPWYTENDKS